MPDDKPQNTKTTVEMAAPPDWAIALTKKVVDGFTAVEKRLDAIETNVDLQGNTVRDVQQRMTAQEARLNGVEDRVTNASLRVRQGSQVDVSHDAAIADLKQKMEDALGILTELRGVAANPLVRRVAYAAGTVVLLYLGAVATRLQSKADAPAPAPVVQLVVPAAAVDGGAK